jgi:hypothetical protein
MPRVVFTKALRRHVDCPDAAVPGRTVREALDAYFAEHGGVRSYVLDERGVLRKHITVFVEGTQVVDRAGLADVVGDDTEVHVMQALSGGCT